MSASKPHATPTPDAFQIEWLRVEFNALIDGDDERLRVTGSRGRQVLDGLVEQLQKLQRERDHFEQVLADYRTGRL